MGEKIKNFLFYSNVNKELYKSIYGDIRQSNLRNVQTFSIIAAVAFFVMVCAGALDSIVYSLRWIYVTCMICMILVCILSRTFAKKYSVMANLLMYFMVAVMLFFGICLGTFMRPDEPTVSYMVLLFAIPLLFTGTPFYMGSLILISLVVYSVLSLFTQSEEMMRFNFISVLPYGVLSIIISSYVMVRQTKSFVYAHENQLLSEVDQLTGLQNRRCYERKLQIIKEKGFESRGMIVALDINGLKNVNDRLGHNAGDELIVGAAECIQAVFGSYGNCYRVGGDEFMAILEAPFPSAQELEEVFIQRMENWHGALVDSVSISYGMEMGIGKCSVDDLAHQADMQMYKYKAEYYKRMQWGAPR